MRPRHGSAGCVGAPLQGHGHYADWGQAYVFERQGGSFVEVARFRPSTARRGDWPQQVLRILEDLSAGRQDLVTEIRQDIAGLAEALRSVLARGRL